MAVIGDQIALDHFAHVVQIILEREERISIAAADDAVVAVVVVIGARHD